VKNDIYGSRITSALEEISALNEYITRLRAKERLLSENLELESRQYSRDSILHINKVLSESSFETSRQTWNRSRLSLQEVRIEQSARSIDLAQKNKALQDYRIMREEEREKLASSLRESWQKLRAEIHIWENTYLLVSPVTGRVTFTKYWSENQSVMTDEQVLTVIPEMSGDYLGRIRLSMTRSGKVTPGRDVYIKLSGYPYLEYGMLRGRVISKSMVPSGDSYVIEVSFPSGLITLYGRKLEFNQNMQGIAEIVTDDLRLIQKIINPFRHLITRNRD
jgi:HlyD family secretion protein